MNRKIQKECESSCEYLLPDYLGDIKRVLYSTARAVPSGEFDSDTSHEVAGIVLYELVYLDSDNKIAVASFSSDYDFSFPKSEDCRGCYVSTSVLSSTERLAGPRKISAKARLVSDIFISEPFEEAVSGTALAEGEDPITVSKSVNVESVIVSEHLEREYSEEIAKIDGELPDDVEIITSSASVKILETEAVDDGINIKGVLTVTAIVKTPEMSVFAVKKEIPFDETVSLEGAASEASVLAEGVLSNVSTSIRELEGAVAIDASLTVDYKAMTLGNEAHSVMLDAYLKTKKTDTSYDMRFYKEHMFAKNALCDTEVKIKRGDVGAENYREIISLCAEYKNPELKKDGFGVEINVDAYISGMACEINESGGASLVPVRFNTPVKFYVKLSCQISENNELYARTTPLDCDFNMDEENIYVMPSVSIALAASRISEEKVLSSCNISPESEIERAVSVISVYYPDSNETLFEIAKKFHTTAAEIAKDNSLSENVLEGGEPFELSRGFDKLIIR